LTFSHGIYCFQSIINNPKQTGSQFEKWQNLLAADRTISKRRLQQLAGRNEFPVNAAASTDVARLDSRPLTGELAGKAFSVEDTIDVQGVPTRAGMPLENLFDEPAEVSDAWVEALKASSCHFAGKVKPPPFGHGLNGGFDSVDKDASSVAPIHIGVDTYGWVRCLGALRGHCVFRAGVGRFIGGLPIVPSMDAPAVIASDWELLRQILPIVFGHRECISALEDPLAANADASTRKRMLLLDYSGYSLPHSCQRAMRSSLPHFDWLSPVQTPARGRGILQASAEAFSTLAKREAHFIHRHWLAEYGASYPPELSLYLQQGGRLSAANITVARDVQRQLRGLLLSLLDEWEVVALPLILAKDNLMEAGGFANKHLLSQLAPIQLSGLPAFSIPLLETEGQCVALQLLTRSGDRRQEDVEGDIGRKLNVG
jgi:Asp-tRNA(Asn)/Glu-tRNA(Gln) amidotransferase A subunit family amidase